jgi:hypothetical protein
LPTWDAVPSTITDMCLCTLHAGILNTIEFLQLTLVRGTKAILCGKKKKS